MINHFKFRDDCKIFAKNENELETIKIYSQDIGMEFGIEICSMLMIKKGKIETMAGIEQPN